MCCVCVGQMREVASREPPVPLTNTPNLAQPEEDAPPSSDSSDDEEEDEFGYTMSAYSPLHAKCYINTLT